MKSQVLGEIDVYKRWTDMPADARQPAFVVRELLKLAGASPEAVRGVGWVKMLWPGSEVQAHYPGRRPRNAKTTRRPGPQRVAATGESGS